MGTEDDLTSQAPSRIIVADDHPLFRSAIRYTLEGHPDLEVVAEAGDGRQALEMCRRFRPELVLMDLRMPVMDGVSATRAIKGELPDTLVLVLTVTDQARELSESLGAGAAGYVLKDASPARIADAVRRVLAGYYALDEDLAMRLLLNLIGEDTKEEVGAASSPSSHGSPGSCSRPAGLLTLREVEVLRLVVQGQTNRQIAQNLSISVSTVKRHIRHVCAKLGTRDRVQAAVRAVELGVLDRRTGF